MTWLLHRLLSGMCFPAERTWLGIHRCVCGRPCEAEYIDVEASPALRKVRGRR